VQADSLIADIVEAVGLTKQEIEVFGTKLLSTTFRHTEQNSLDEDGSEAGDFYCPKLLPVDSETRANQNEVITKGDLPPIEEEVDTAMMDAISSKLGDCVFSKDEQ
jgi:hypothetical protein